MIKQFNNKSLDLFKAKFDAHQAQKKDIVDSLQKAYDRNNKSKFLYTLNFGMNHLESEVTPYIVLTEMYNANIKALDTVYNNLDEKVLNSKYGLELKKFVDDVKSKETEN